MKKKKQMFLFFSIEDAASFKTHLSKDIHPLITTTTELLDVNTQPVTAVNIAFSQSGLTALGVSDSLGDDAFTKGQFSDASNLGDPGTGNWESSFAGTSVHGVFLMASDTIDNVNDELANIQNILGNSAKEVHRLLGEARPGDQEGHEREYINVFVQLHTLDKLAYLNGIDFGYMDGISQPAVQGFTSSPTPGQHVAPPGLFLLGHDGDSTTRPTWATGGSFLAFRQLKQLVPEFKKFLADNPLQVDGLSTEAGSELLGARMVGRWRSVSFMVLCTSLRSFLLT